MQSITVGAPDYALIVDDHPLVAQGFAHYLLTHFGFASIQIARNEQECLYAIETYGCPEIAIVDFWLVEGTALSLLHQLTSRCDSTRILVVSGDDDNAISKLVQLVKNAGGHGFLHKQATPESFSEAVTALQMRKTYFSLEPDSILAHTSKRDIPIEAKDLGLTKRQGEVLNLILRGLPNKRIARDLNITEQTVKEHMTNILTKLGATSRLEVINLLRGKKLTP